MNKNLLILGAGQYAYVVEDIATAMGCFERIAFLDDNAERAVGKLSDLERFKDEYSYGIVAIGNPSVRLDLINKLKKGGYCVAKLVHPMAFVSPTAFLGKGVIVEPMAVVQANSVIGDGSIISSGAIIRHNGVVEAGCHCDCGCTVLSNSVVKCGTKVECGAVHK